MLRKRVHYFWRVSPLRRGPGRAPPLRSGPGRVHTGQHGPRGKLYSCQTLLLWARGSGGVARALVPLRAVQAQKRPTIQFSAIKLHDDKPACFLTSRRTAKHNTKTTLNKTWISKTQISKLYSLSYCSRKTYNDCSFFISWL